MDGVIYLVADNTKKVYLYNPEGNMWEKVSFRLYSLFFFTQKT